MRRLCDRGNDTIEALITERRMEGGVSETSTFQYHMEHHMMFRIQCAACPRIQRDVVHILREHQLLFLSCYLQSVALQETVKIQSGFP